MAKLAKSLIRSSPRKRGPRAFSEELGLRRGRSRGPRKTRKDTNTSVQRRRSCFSCFSWSKNFGPAPRGKSGLSLPYRRVQPAAQIIDHLGAVGLVEHLV